MGERNGDENQPARDVSRGGARGGVPDARGERVGRRGRERADGRGVPARVDAYDRVELAEPVAAAEDDARIREIGASEKELSSEPNRWQIQKLEQPLA